MSEPLDNLYLKWLYALIGSVKVEDPKRTYWGLARELYVTEFLWSVPNDDNRISDGRDLRYRFRDETNTDIDRLWLGLGCSVFEMLIALAELMAFEADKTTAYWFWHLMDNLDLSKYNDAAWEPRSPYEIGEKLHAFMHREYAFDGTGGLFPMPGISQDQRDVEIWYQMNEYLLERTVKKG